MLTFLYYPEVIRFSLHDDFEIGDVGTELLYFLVVELGGALGVLFDIKSRAYVDDHLVRCGQIALDVEGVGQRDENVFFIFIFGKCG